jgi:hypothetical protein
MDAIATYSERRLGAWRKFSLYRKEILVIGGRISGHRFESRIPFASLDPTVSRVFIRSEFFLIGICLALGCTFCCLILASLSPATSWSYWPVLSIMVFGIIGFILAGLSFRKIEFIQFRSQAGVTILDVARSGPDRHNFDKFIDELVRQIQSTRNVA